MALSVWAAKPWQELCHVAWSGNCLEWAGVQDRVGDRTPPPMVADCLPPHFFSFLFNTNNRKGGGGRSCSGWLGMAACYCYCWCCCFCVVVIIVLLLVLLMHGIVLLQHLRQIGRAGVRCARVPLEVSVLVSENK